MPNDAKHCWRILVIEDNPADADLIEAFFRPNEATCEILFAKDGEEALVHLGLSPNSKGSVTPPDLVLLDINIPRIDGLDVLRRLKQHPQLKLVPVVVLTSSEHEEDIRRSYEFGASCVVIKPCELDEVVSRFRLLEEFWLKTVKLPGKLAKPRSGGEQAVTPTAP